jgi:hypothetical protein
MAERLGKDPHTIRRARVSGLERAVGAKGVGGGGGRVAKKHADELERRVRELRRRSRSSAEGGER